MSVSVAPMRLPARQVHDTNRALNWAWMFTWMGLTAHILLSADALYWLGIPYYAPFGSPFAKIHPGSYLLILSLMTGLASQGNPLRVMGWLMKQHRLLSAYFVCMVLVLAWALYRHGTAGQTFLIEALWMPAIATYAILLHDTSRQRKAFTLVMCLIIANAALALIEYATKSHLVTYVPPVGVDSVVDDFFRSSAFLGHPLENALVTVSLIPAVSLLAWSVRARVVCTAIMCFAMLAYGGRTSLAVGLMAYSLLVAVQLGSGLVRGRFSYLQLTGGSLALVVGLTLFAVVVLSTGLGERIFNNLQWDNSASVRTRVLDAFNYVTTEDLWFGITTSEIDLVKLKLGLDPRFEAIENFWIYLLLNLGIVGFTPFVTGLACLIIKLLQKASGPMCVAVIVYFVAGSTANTLAAKTSSLMLLVVAIYAGASLIRTQHRP